MSPVLPPVAAAFLAALGVVVGVGFPGYGPVILPARLFAIGPLLAEAALVRSARMEFAHHRATIGTFDDPTTLITLGPFARSRNPMYVGMALLLSGLAIGVGSVTAWIAPVGFVALCGGVYIPYEERRHRRIFGVAYADYSARVGRWCGPMGRARQSRDAADPRHC